MESLLIPLEIEKGSLCFYSIFSIDLWGADAREVDRIWEKFCEDRGLEGKNKQFREEQDRDESIYDYFNPIFKCAYDEKDCDCFRIVDDFHSVPDRLNIFYREKLGCIRFRSGNIWLRLIIFVTFYPDRNLGIIYFNVCLDGLTVDKVIEIRQLFEGFKDCNNENEPNVKKNSFFKKGEGCSFERGGLRDLCEYLIRDLSFFFKEASERHNFKNVIVDDTEKMTFMIFNRSVLDIQAVNSSGCQEYGAKKWAENNCLAMYGLVTGDEGYKYVPLDFALFKIGYGWGARSFIYIFAYGGHVVSLNFKHAFQGGKEYVLFEEELNKDVNVRKRYFNMRCCVAGVDHGVGMCVERSMVVEYEYNYIVNREIGWDITFVQKRNKALTFISQTVFVREEIENLYDLISKASGTARSVDLMKQRCSIELDEKILYNNFLIIILTCVSSILAFLSASSGLMCDSARSTISILFVCVFGLCFRRTIGYYVIGTVRRTLDKMKIVIGRSM